MTTAREAADKLRSQYAWSSDELLEYLLKCEEDIKGAEIRISLISLLTEEKIREEENNGE